MSRVVIEGKLQGNARGYAFLIPTEEGEDYFIPHSDLRGAMHGDYVLAEKTDGTGERTTARVLKILERGIKEVVGTYYSYRNGGFVTPDDDKYFTDIFVPSGKGVRARNGDKVVCKILSYPKKKCPEGLISKILGRQFEKNAELKSILYTYKLSERFNENTLKDADNLPSKISSEEIKNRLDLRDDLTFTIDGETAKDFDDAVSISRIENGYRLGVHIADVSHYVKEGGFIDAEAFNRGTSVYFPESVIPMLPERLCNDLCSLKPNEDRLTLSCIVDLNKKGEVLDSQIVSSVINSKYRLTYLEVQQILDGNLTTKYPKSLVDSLKLMDELTDILIAKRDEKGNIDLDVKESEIYINNGEIQVEIRKRLKSHKIIEEFMILANTTVAEYFYYLDLPFVYRVHGKPSEDRLQNFYAFLDGLGVAYRRRKDEIFSKDFQTILKNVDQNISPLVNRVMLRSMQKAKYSPDCQGHFGLSEKFYCHFTSPIRRYPDLAIHRIIKDFLRNGTEKLEQKYRGFVEDASIQSSERERVAWEAEMDVDKFYKLLYIKDKVGEEFDGVISGVMNFGIFVELENGVEGIVKVETLRGKGYEYDKNKFSLSNGNVSYKLGQKVRIQVAGINLNEKRAEFILIEENI